MNTSSSTTFTKAETVALWHAVNNFKIMVREMPKIPGITPYQIEVEQKLLAEAQRGLRKANELRKAGQ